MVEMKRLPFFVFGIAAYTFSPQGHGFSSCLDITKNDEYIPFVGAYYDSVNKFNLKAGLSYIINQKVSGASNDSNASCNHGYANLIYIDYLLSEDTDALGLGWGRYFGGATYRIGISKISKHQETYKGVEGTVSVFSYSFKIGVYDKERDNDTEFLVGVGLEF